MNKNENFYYLCYVLGYDLLQNRLKDCIWNACDETFDICQQIIEKFLASEENKNANKSQYDSLVEFIDNNSSYIDYLLDMLPF